MATTEEKRRMDKVLLSSILLSDAIGVAVNQAATFHAECAEVGNQAGTIHHMLWLVVRLDGSLFCQPVLHIADDVSKNLKRALTLVSKCRGVAIGLLCLAKHIAKEPGELQLGCLMVIMEITAAC